MRPAPLPGSTGITPFIPMTGPVRRASPHPNPNRFPSGPTCFSFVLRAGSVGRPPCRDSLHSVEYLGTRAHGQHEVMTCAASCSPVVTGFHRDNSIYPYDRSRPEGFPSSGPGPISIAATCFRSFCGQGQSGDRPAVTASIPSSAPRAARTLTRPHRHLHSAGAVPDPPRITPFIL